MRTAGIVFRRELGAFFDSPIAYVVAIGFLLLNSALWVLDLWAVNEASLRGFFEWVSWSSCFIIPAITMRTWADERRSATFELLLTLPSSTAWIVLGKFLAALAFYAFCLAGSLVLPICLQALSVEGLGPDWGAIVAGYLGCLATGALLIALGLFLSGLCRDQIEAFIVTLVVVLVLRLLGFAPIASQVDAVVAGAGSFLLEFVSFSTPLMRFIRGVVGLGDVLFFVAWIAGFLLLNAVFVEESRLKPGARSRKLAAALLGIPAIVLLGSLALELKPRADLTAEKLYTVSDAASEILEQIPEGEPVHVKLYFSPKNEMPAFMATLERDVTERLEALQQRSAGRLAVSVVHLHADDAILKAQEMLRAQLGEEEEQEESAGKAGEVEETLLKEGVVPFRVRSGGITGTETKVVYAAVTLTQGARPKEIIPQLMPGQVGALEQELLTRIWRMVKDEKPVVGLLAPIENLSIDPAQLQLLAQLGMPVQDVPRERDDYRMIPVIVGQGERIDVRRIRPSDAKPLPEGMKTLVIIQPGELSERMRWEISRFLHRGGSVIVAAQAFEYGLRPVRGGAAVELRKGEPGVAELLSQYGISVPSKMVLAKESFPLSYDLGPFQGPVTVDFRWSFQLDAANFDRETSLANGLGNLVVIQAASPVEKDDAKLAELGLTFRPVLSTGAESWTRDVPEGTIPKDINDVQAAAGPIPLAALIRGTFPAPDATPPPWPGSEEAAPEPPADDAAAAAPGRLLVIGMANPFRDEQVAADGGLSWSGVLAKNAVEAFSLGDVLMKLTVREATPRPLKDVDRGTLLAYEAVMIGLAPVLVAILGILRLLARKRKQLQPYVRSTSAAPPASGSAENPAAGGAA